MIYLPHVNTATDFSNSRWNILLMTPEVKRALLKLGDKPYIVFSHYLEEVYVDSPNFSIEHTASVLGLTTLQVQKATKKLIDSNWVYFSEYSDNKGHKFILAVIGYNSVAQFKNLDIKPELYLTGANVELYVPGKYYEYEDELDEYEDDPEL